MKSCSYACDKYRSLWAFLFYRNDAWCKREAYLEIERRRALGLPLIDANYADPKELYLPTDEELGEDFEVIIWVAENQPCRSGVLMILIGSADAATMRTCFVEIRVIGFFFILRYMIFPLLFSLSLYFMETKWIFHWKKISSVTFRAYHIPGMHDTR